MLLFLSGFLAGVVCTFAGLFLDIIIVIHGR